MPIYRDKAKGRWRFEFTRRFPAGRVRATKLLPKGWSRSQAERFDTRESARLAAQASGIETDRPRLAGAVQLYLEHHCPDLKDGKKTAQDLATLYDYIEPAWLDEVAEVSARYRQDSRGKLGQGTVSKRLSLLKAAVRYAYRRHGYGDRDYTDRMVVPAPNNERQVYATVPQLDKLWRKFPDLEARACFMLAFHLGLRWRAELLPRKPEDVRTQDGDQWLVIGMTKNGTPRMVPVHPSVKGMLRYLPFAHEETWYYDRWRDAVKKAGLDGLRPHDLRHSLASAIVSGGGSLVDVSGALHHRSLSASRRYSHLYPERLKRVLFGVGKPGKSTPRR